MSFLFLVFSTNILDTSWQHVLGSQVMDEGWLPYMKIMVLFVTRNELQWIRVSLYFLEGSLVSYKAP